MTLLGDPTAPLDAAVELQPRPPAPDDRWRPTRAGLVSVWRYWDEAFEFHDGRLLLRGPNGSGKSMALELLLPFVLDGDANPAKLTSAAKSRGGLYERLMTGATDTTRTGYVWVEFRRGDDTFTSGARLRASASTKTVNRSFFTSNQTVGRDLELLDASRVPLSRAALVEAVGEHGRVTDVAAEHRDAVRAVLFPEFSADRYEALVGALLALRKEKLSQHLDLDKLSEVLSEALPTIDEHELAAVAEGFERLDRRRDRIAELEGDVAELADLGRRQRAYARAVLATVADGVRAAESSRDGVVRRQRTAGEDLERVQQELDGNADEEGRARDRKRDVTGELDGLRRSDLYREGGQLAERQQDLAAREAERDRLAVSRDDRVADHDEARERAAEAEVAAAEAVAHADRAERELRAAAEEAGAGGALVQALAGVAEAPDPSAGAEQASALLSAWVGERHAAIAEIRGLLADHTRAVDRREAAAAQLDARRARVDELTTALRGAAAALDDERNTHREAVVAWSASIPSFTDEWRASIARAVRGLLPGRGRPPTRKVPGAPVTRGETDDAEGASVARTARSVDSTAVPSSGADDGDHPEVTTARTGVAEPAPVRPSTEGSTGDGEQAAAAGPTRSDAEPLGRDTDGTAADEPVVEVVDAVDAAVAQLRRWHAGAVARAEAERDERRARLDEARARLVDELEPLRAGGWPLVEAPSWRAPRAADRAGAPLWRLVDVADGTPADVVEGLESALVAAGLIDAWVAPTGTVEVPSAADLVLAPLDPERRSESSLADHLRPADAVDELGVPRGVVSGVLASIATAPSAPTANTNRKVVIGLDGSFRVGAAVGRGPTRPATLLGAVARERHRQAEIDRLSAEIEELDRRLRGVAAEAERAATQAAATIADLDACPSRAEVDAALDFVNAAEVRLGEADAARVAAEADLAAAEDLARALQRALMTRASAVQAPTDGDGLDRLAAAVERVAATARVWRQRTDERATKQRQVRLADDAATRAERAAVDAGQRWQYAVDVAAQLAAKVAAIRSALGTGYDELLARVAALEAEETELDERLERLHAAEVGLAGQRGTAQQALADATTALEAAEQERGAAHRRLVDLESGPLPTDADVEPADGPLDGVTAVLARARALAGVLDGVAGGPEEVDRLSRRVEGRLHEASSHLGIRVDLERVSGSSGWLELRGSTGGVRLGLTELRGQLGRQLAEAHAELQAEEAALFERTLSGSIRQALADRIRGANDLVDGINRQLAAVQTQAGGVGVRLRWDVDDDEPDAVRTARALLLRDPADLGDDERAALTEFVRSRVDQARATLDAHVPWEARLRESLDYRRWHRFSLQVAHRDWEGFKAATPRLLQRLSTGERSVALHLPMIASLAAHYTGADGKPGAGPRLILLDELFAGVDTANRAQLFGTFTQWDLDAVFTSDHEWCQYATLSGIAIHHLQGGQDDEPVTSTRFTWDGHHRRIDPGLDSRGLAR